MIGDVEVLGRGVAGAFSSDFLQEKRATKTRIAMAPHKNLLFNCFISQIIHLSVLSYFPKVYT